MNCGDHQTIKSLNIHFYSLCLKPVLSWLFPASILTCLDGFLPFLCGEFHQQSYSSAIKWVLPSVGCRTSHPKVPVWSKPTERAHCLHTICTKIHRIILTIPEPWQIYRPSTDMAAGSGKWFIWFSNSQRLGRFSPAGSCALYWRLPPGLQKSHLWGICSFQAFHVVIFGCACGDFWSPSTAIFIAHGCEVHGMKHNLILNIGVPQDHT